MTKKHCDLTENLLGAFVLEIGDRMDAGVSEAAGLGANGPGALVLLAQESSLAIGELASLLRVSHPAAVQLVDRLAAHSLVDRRPGEDARVRKITLTSKGRKAATAVLAGRAGVLHDALSVLDSGERATLRRLLDRMVSGLDLDRAASDHFCRLCDLSVCTTDVCPAEASAQAADARARAAALVSRPKAKAQREAASR